MNARNGSKARARHTSQYGRSNPQIIRIETWANEFRSCSAKSLCLFAFGRQFILHIKQSGHATGADVSEIRITS